MLELSNINAFFNDNAKIVAKKNRDDAADVKVWKSGKCYVADAIADTIDDGMGYTHLFLMDDCVVLSNFKISTKTITLKLSQKKGTFGRTIALKNSIFSVDATRRLDSCDCLINATVKNNDGNDEPINAIVIAIKEEDQAQVLEKYQKIFKA